MTERLFYLDALRGILMMGGVLLHAGYVASIGHTWAISGSGGSLAAYYLVEMIQYFRMPAFFVVSGFFCLMMLRKYGTERFLSVRLRRIAIPMIATALTLNIIQRIFLAELNSERFTLSDYFTKGQWVSHLWFLVYLIFYFLLATGFHVLAPLRAVKRMTSFTIPRKPGAVFVILLVLPLYTLVLSAVDHLVSLTYDLGGIIDTYEFLYYLQFFIVGYWLFSRPVIMETLVRMDLWKLVLAIIVGASANALWGGAENYQQAVVDEYTRMVWVWSAVVLCLGVFHRYADSDSRIMRYLSEASYSVYLFHHLLVIVIAAMLLHISTPPLLLLLLTSLGAFLIALGIHHFIVRRVPIVQYLFNGKWTAHASS